MNTLALLNFTSNQLIHGMKLPFHTVHIDFYEIKSKLGQLCILFREVREKKLVFCPLLLTI